MDLLNKIIESALINIDHDFYAFHRFDRIEEKPLKDKSSKAYPYKLDKEKVVQLHVITPKKNNYLIWNYPEEWAKQYVQGDYSNIDPVVAKLKSRFNPFIWGEGYFNPEDLDLEEKEKVIKEAQNYSLYQGISVPIGNHLSSHGSMTIAFKKNKFISETSFFCIAAHLRTIGNMMFKLQDFTEGKIDIPLEEYEELFKFLKNSNHSCTAAM